jgi:hypothetical protein
MTSDGPGMDDERVRALVDVLIPGDYGWEVG